MLYSLTLFFIHPIYTSSHLLIPSSQSTLPSCPTLATLSPFSSSMSQFLFHRYVHLCHILDFTYKSDDVLYRGPRNLATSASKEEKFSHSGVLPQGGASSFPFLFTGGKKTYAHIIHTHNTIILLISVVI